MEKVVKKRELKITMPNRIGVVAEISGLIAEKGVNIDNFCVYVADDKAVLLLLTNDNEKVKSVLKEKGYQIEEREVILLVLWNRPGVLAEVVTQFKENGINLHYVYGTSTTQGVATTIIFDSDDNHKASKIFDSVVLERNEKGL